MKVINTYVIKSLHDYYCTLFECEKDLWYIDRQYYYVNPVRYGLQPIQTDEAVYILDTTKIHNLIK